MRFLLSAFISLVASSLVLSSPAPQPQSSAFAPSISKNYKPLSGVTIFTPPRTYIVPRTLYARSVQLPDGTLLATWENYSNETLDGTAVYFPIFRSTDAGETWIHISNVTDTVNSWGLRYQPDLYRLPKAFGSLPKGAILCSGNSIPTDLNYTKIDIYYSLDDGFTWKFLSTVASGGRAIPDNGLTPIWEPFLLLHANQLICYYSDQRDPLHGQKMVHQVSTDGIAWGPVVDDVSYSEYTARPGMPTVARLPNGKWILSYEYGGGPGFSGYSFPVYYRISDSPLTFNDSVGIPVEAAGIRPTSSPFIVWSPTGGKNGTLVVSGGSNSQVFTNKALGAVDSWEVVETPQERAYTRSLRVLDKSGHLLILGGGFLGGSNNNVSLSIVQLT